MVTAWPSRPGSDLIASGAGRLATGRAGTGSQVRQAGRRVSQKDYLVNTVPQGPFLEKDTKCVFPYVKRPFVLQS